MSLKQKIKEKICVAQQPPGFSVGSFVHWAEHVDCYVVLYYLEVIQQEMEVERLAAQENEGRCAGLQAFRSTYCAKLIKYYCALLSNPCCRSSLSLLLNSLPQRLQR